METKFGTALNCIDGRIQLTITNWIIENYKVDYVDLITEPGIDKVLSQNNLTDIKKIKENAIVSVEAHGSNIIVVSGHHDCAANSVSESQHYHDIKMAVDVVVSWGLSTKVVGIWVDEFWRVHVVDK